MSMFEIILIKRVDDKTKIHTTVLVDASTSEEAQMILSTHPDFKDESHGKIARIREVMTSTAVYLVNRTVEK